MTTMWRFYIRALATANPPLPRLSCSVHVRCAHRLAVCLPFKNETVNALCFGANSKYLVSGGSSGLVKIWDMKRKEMFKPLSVGWRSFTCLLHCVCPVDIVPARPCYTAAAHLWLLLGTVRASLSGAFGWNLSKQRSLPHDFTPARTPARTTHLLLFQGHSKGVSTVVFNNESTCVASGSESGDILIHSLLKPSTVPPLPLRSPQTQGVRSLRYSPFLKDKLMSCTDDGSVTLWDTATMRLSHHFDRVHKAPATGVAFSPFNHLLVCSVGLDKRIIFYDVEQRK